MIEVVTPNSREEWLELRKSTIGASELAALFGEHPWLTPYKLFAQKTGQYEEKHTETKILENSIHLSQLERGNFMEPSIFEALRMLRPQWTVTSNAIPGGHMFIDRDTGVSSTPDAFIDKGDFSGVGAFQGKDVAQMAFNRGWRSEDGEIEFPLYVAIQAIADATLSECQWACAGALVKDFGMDFYLIDVPLTPGLMDKAREKVKDFWRRVRENDPYPPDYGRDGDVIKRIFANDDGGEIDLSHNTRVLDLLPIRAGLVKCEAAGRAANTERESVDAELRHLLGNATRARLADGWILEAKTVRVKGYQVHPKTYRPVKIKQERKKSA